MKKVLTILFVTSYLFAREVTTHRAIDRTALESAQTQNLKNFITDSGLENETYEKKRVAKGTQMRWLILV